MTRRRSIIDLSDPTGGSGRTKQSFKDDCDINLIVERHGQRGMWDHLNPRVPHYGDNTRTLALQDAYQLVNDADGNFDTLPAEVRAVCSNDPVQLLKLAETEEGFTSLVAAGMPTTPEFEPPVIREPPEPDLPSVPVGGKPPEEPEN